MGRDRGVSQEGERGNGYQVEGRECRNQTEITDRSEDKLGKEAEHEEGTREGTG